jgi:rod shape-determining protein MreC
MLKFLSRLVYKYREYILLTFLLVISLSLLSSNDKPLAKHLKIFAIGNFSIFNEISTKVISIFHQDDSIPQLKEENAKLMLELNRIRKTGAENTELRSMLSLNDTSKYPLIPARVVSKLITVSQGNFIINRGAKDEITKGMPVLNQNGLIGLISDVSENYSTIKTLFNSNLSIAITIQRTNVSGILTFDGANLIIKNIPSTYDIQVGDRIETSEFSSIFPPSVPVGVVLKKETINLGLLHRLTVQPLADIAGVNDLFVMKIVPSKQINQLEMNLLK